MTSQLEKLKEKQQQLQARIKLVEAKEKQKQRKEDTRRKILIGAMVMDGMSKNDDYKAKIETNLKKYLTKDTDKKLFGLDE